MEAVNAIGSVEPAERRCLVAEVVERKWQGGMDRQGDLSALIKHVSVLPNDELQAAVPPSETEKGFDAEFPPLSAV